MSNNLFLRNFLNSDCNNNKALKALLYPLINSTVVVTTTFSTVTGVLAEVKKDYIIINETSGNVVLIPLNSIELVSSETGGIA